MNGYQLTADSYSKVLERDRSKMGADDIKSMEDNIRVLECLATFSGDDKYIAFNSSMFNDILQGYCLKAIDEFIEDGEDEERKAAEILRNKISGKFHSLLDRMTASEAEAYYMEH